MKDFEIDNRRKRTSHFGRIRFHLDEDRLWIGDTSLNGVVAFDKGDTEKTRDWLNKVIPKLKRRKTPKEKRE